MNLAPDPKTFLCMCLWPAAVAGLVLTACRLVLERNLNVGSLALFAPLLLLTHKHAVRGWFYD
jgi:hypothetical protein